MRELRKLTLNKLVPFARAVTLSSRIALARSSFLISHFPPLILDLFFLPFYFRSVCIPSVLFNSVSDLYIFSCLILFQIYARLLYECWLGMDYLFFLCCYDLFFVQFCFRFMHAFCMNAGSEWIFFVCVVLIWILFDSVFNGLEPYRQLCSVLEAAVNFTSERGNK